MSNQITVTGDTPNRIVVRGDGPTITIQVSTVPLTGADGTTVHGQLTGRDEAEQHPIDAITDLVGRLAGRRASVILWVPSLTPDPGDTIKWVARAPGQDNTVDGIPYGYSVITSYSWGDYWDNEGTTYVLLFVADATALVYAEVTADGFTPIQLVGGETVLLGCGVSPLFGSTGSLWYGWNDNGYFGVTDPAQPATDIRPIAVTDADVAVRTDYTGALSGQSSLRGVLDFLDAAAPLSQYHYNGVVSVNPWSQGTADLGVVDVFVSGVVTPTNNIYFVQATFDFRAGVSSTSTDPEATATLSVSKLFRALDPDTYAGWYWSYVYGAVTPVDGVYGGLPFNGFVNGSGNIVDADGATVARPLIAGDYLSGTITGVFSND
ncbi:MAG: hypothetical protein ACOYOQ_00010 [Microthrixaceae bacterium]